MTAKEMHALLANQNIRLFNLSLGKDTVSLIHGNKTVKEWRSDVRNFISIATKINDEDGFANDEVFNSIMGRLRDAGYIEVGDVVSDVFEGRIALYAAGVIDEPAHEEQADGFGHYGWKSKI